MAAISLSVAVLAASASAALTAAQPAVAPPPRHSLNEVVKEYLRLGLPLPPPGAPLVRVGVWINPEACQNEERKHPLNPCAIWRYRLGFQLPPPWPGADPRYWFGLPWQSEERRLEDWHDPRYVEPAEPTPDALRLANLQDEQAVWLAVACRLRGWDELAERLYARGLELYDGYVHDDVITELQSRACWWLVSDLTRPGTDRAAVVRRLKALAAGNKDVYTPGLGELDALEAGLKSRVSPPGSIEALIDGLTEYCPPRFESDPAAGEAPYWALAEKGFDAVPALIDHLADKRLTRRYSSMVGKGFPGRVLTVGHVCCEILNALSGETFGGGYWDGRGDPPDPKVVRKWFAAAKKVGEERWLLRRAEIDHRYALRVLGAKYPDRLPAVYRAALLRGDGLPDALTGAVLASRLTRDQKLTLLTEAVDHDYLDHRTAALRVLETFDPPRFRHHLRRTVSWVRDRVVRGELKVPNRVGQGGPEEPSPIDLVPFVERAGDSACWDLLSEVARKSPPAGRMGFVSAVEWLPPDRPDPARRDRLGFLAGFLNDRTAAPVVPAESDEWEPWNGIEVRDYAAGRLAGLLRFPVYREGSLGVMVDRVAGPLSRLIFREAVRAAAERELARPPRPAKR